MTKNYLFWCANEHIDFRVPEIEALAAKLNINFKWIEIPSENPYLIIELHSEENACKLIENSMLIRSCYELWGSGTSSEELHSTVKSNMSFIEPYLKQGNSFKVNIKTFNKHLEKKEHLDKIESFSYLPFEGKVDLKNPYLVLQLIEFYGLSPNDIPNEPFKLFFGRWLKDGQRELIHLFSLKRRTFIGSTSMDAKLAFLMTNMAQVGPGTITIDPFVGTGSILVSAAKRGSFVWGWDIDFQTLHARSKPTRHSQKSRHSTESILSNLNQYGLSDKYLDVLVMDSSNPSWRNCGIIDAIITDPPYGIRESTEKVGTSKEKVESVPQDCVHYPSKTNYNLADIYVDLLNMAASHLKIGGRLVCFVPIYLDDYSDKVIPTHPCLRLEFNSEQILNTHSSRRLITFVKIRNALSTETADATALSKSEEFRLRFFQASQELSKEDRLKRKMACPTDKRGQGLGYRVKQVASGT